MNKEILINVAPHEKRIAILEDRKLTELIVERPDQNRVVGNIYKGRVVNVLPGLQSAFIDIGLLKPAFMNLSDMQERSLRYRSEDGEEALLSDEQPDTRRRLRIEHLLKKGQSILVQVIKEPLSTKGARVTNGLSIAGRFLVLVAGTDFIGVSKKTRDRGERRRLKDLIASLKPDGIGFIVRTVAFQKSDREFETEIKNLVGRWQEVVKQTEKKEAPALLHQEERITSATLRDLFTDAVSRVLVDDRKEYQQIQKVIGRTTPELSNRVIHYVESQPLFTVFNVEEQIENTLARKVFLKSGGYLIFDYAEAMVVIDVNTGRSQGRRNAEETIFNTNMEAAREIARQLRLRDLGGLIVIDFIDMMVMENRRKLLEEFHNILKKDRAPFNIGKISEFGILEMTRKRVRENLIHSYTEICTGCSGTGRIFSKASVVSSIDRFMGYVRNILGFKRARLVVSSALAAYFLEDRKTVLREISNAAGIKIDLETDPELPMDKFKIFDKDKKQEFTELF
ncbi:MAG: hypothetical protein A2293_08515 [Elusimicrobia bacterium RIFOXYB2_FULL_49_7]|nr:MAG: hypothetical protein A2293_08515 [Elusimicrobia bacterium RIFOXYB2_FULL_49_7]